MSRNAYVFCCLVLTIAGLGGCSGGGSASQSKNTAAVRDKIQGTAQIVLTENSEADKALSAGGSSAYIWEGMRRYRLFLKTPVEIEGGKEYVVEGVYAQKVIDEIGDPDQGKNGYPLQASCRRVVKMAWPGMSLDATDAQSGVLRARVRRFPARPVFVVTKIEPKEAGSGDVKKVAAGEEDAPEISVPAEKQQVLLVEGKTVLPAPLWAPDGGSVNCPVLIDTKGNVAELQTGAQLCESVPWGQFRYSPTVQRGRPVKVTTEVAVRFDPRK